jgi:hypothetical protein
LTTPDASPSHLVSSGREPPHSPGLALAEPSVTVSCPRAPTGRSSVDAANRRDRGGGLCLVRAREVENQDRTSSITIDRGRLDEVARLAIATRQGRAEGVNGLARSCVHPTSGSSSREEQVGNVKHRWPRWDCRQRHGDRAATAFPRTRTRVRAMEPHPIISTGVTRDGSRRGTGGTKPDAVS